MFILTYYILLIIWSPVLLLLQEDSHCLYFVHAFIHNNIEGQGICFGEIMNCHFNIVTGILSLQRPVPRYPNQYLFHSL